jgi:hypothetical protein
VRGSAGRNGRAAIAGLCIAIGLLGSAALEAQDDDKDKDKPSRELPPPEGPPLPPRPQEINLSYRFNLSYPGHIDRENIASLTMTASDAIHFAMQDGADDQWYLRIPKWGAAFALDTAIRYVSHEYGHLSSFSKGGYHQALFGDKDRIQSSAPKASIGRMFLSGFNPFDNSAVSISQSDWDKIVGNLGHDPVLVSKFTVSVKAGGLNQEEVNLDRYADRLFDGELSYLDTLPFLISGAAVLKYPVGIEMSDVGDYITELKGLGLRTSAGTLHALSAATLLSGSSLAAFRGAFLGLTGRSGGLVEPFRFPINEQLSVYLPEMDNYLSIFGPTLKSSIPLRLYGVLLQPSYEHLFVDGATKGEAGISVRAPVFPFLIVEGSGYRNFEGGSWLESELRFLPLKWLSLGLGYAWGRGYTFHRDVYGASNDLLDSTERSVLIGLSAFHMF